MLGIEEVGEEGYPASRTMEERDEVRGMRGLFSMTTD
jgi:hypothetical protein